MKFEFWRKLCDLIIKCFTHNLCDSCGFTKDQVFITEIHSETCTLKCQKCIDKELNKTKINNE